MRFHVVSLPHTQVTSQYAACAFTQKVARFCQMMKAKGHKVFLYAGEEADAPRDELITCITEEQRKMMLGPGQHYTTIDWGRHTYWHQFNQNAIRAMGERLEQQDFICLIGGHAQKVIADAFPAHLSVEFGIGYSGTFAKYRVFESYAWMHAVYGAQAGDPSHADGFWYDAVIPNQFDPALFPEIKNLRPKGLHGPIDFGLRGITDEEAKAKEFIVKLSSAVARERRLHEITCKQCNPKGYYLYVGRMIERKGYKIAQELCESLGKRLILAGPGDQWGYGEFVGEVDPAERYNLMAGATAMFAPTIYVEPFGTVTIEAMASGTPVLTTDWGAFTETVSQGVDGYRCRTWSEFVEAMAKIESGRHLHRRHIRRRAFERFSIDVVATQYDAYFKRLSTLWGKGWYA